MDEDSTSMTRIISYTSQCLLQHGLLFVDSIEEGIDEQGHLQDHDFVLQRRHHPLIIAVHDLEVPAIHFIIEVVLQLT